jgi:glycyl-tRNA synthetase alpha subunit
MMMKVEAMQIIDSTLRNYDRLMQALYYFQRMDIDKAADSAEDKEYIRKAYNLIAKLDATNIRTHLI